MTVQLTQSGENSFSVKKIRTWTPLEFLTKLWMNTSKLTGGWVLAFLTRSNFPLSLIMVRYCNYGIPLRCLNNFQFKGIIGPLLHLLGRSHGMLPPNQNRKFTQPDNFLCLRQELYVPALCLPLD